MKKLLFFALAIVALTFASCKKEQPKYIPDNTPQTEVNAEEELTKDFNTALNNKDGNKIAALLDEFTAKVKDVVKKPETLEKIKEQLPIIQKWVADNKEAILGILGEKGASIVDAFVELKIPDMIGAN